MSKKKVLVVDDSAFMRKVIKDLIESDPALEVVDTARNGQEALDKLRKLKPDCITMDVEMPILDGLSTLERIVRDYPGLPVIMLSSTTATGTENTLRALELGAFDFVTKPSGSISLDIHKVKEELLEKVKLACTHVGRPAPTLASPFVVEEVKTSPWIPTSKKPHVKVSTPLKNIILMGTSTGGPRALQKVLQQLPKWEDTAILIVQHMPPLFTKSLAKRLDQLSPYHVQEAEDGQLIQGGHVYIAPGGVHMEIKVLASSLAIHLHQGPPKGGHRPSVDILFASAANISKQQVIAVVMTGMGKDGTEGLKTLKRARKVYTIAEHESTCIVYGMPRSIVEANLADEVVPLEQIHLVLERLTNRRR